ncbi:MAG TPA: serine/threonine-protein kinase [Ktedonobacteraceae bacterium]|nr:serine/threonine-protein kinase [Ktedonobacteraceae bacterium]
MVDRAGQQLGNYTLMRKLGEGGFAEVYLAEHIHLGTQAAIKVLHTQLSADSMDEFRTEARTIARLIHPSIVRVLEFGIEEKTPFLVMDYAPNGTLRQKHPKGVPLPLTTIVSYVKQIASALHYAHEEKLIHRDVKPENMLVGRRDEILLSDFGIALVAQSSRLQSTQEVVGTVSYMAPEQIQGKPRPASDQYALGIVVYEWLSGTRPFQGSFTELCTQHMFASPPSLREKMPNISNDVELVVMTALAKDPKARFGTLQAFANALEQASQSVSRPSVAPLTLAPPTVRVLVNTEPIPPPPPNIRYTQPVAPQPPFRYVAPPVSSSPYIKGRPASSSSGKLPLRVYERHTQIIRTVAWSPNGMLIASGSSDKTVHIWNTATGQGLQVYRLHNDGVNDVTWSLDGKYVISASDDKTVHKWQADTGHNMLIYRGHADMVRCAAYLSNSELIVSGGAGKVVLVSGAIRGQRILSYIGHKRSINALAFSPNESYIASASDDGTIQVWDVAVGRTSFIYSGHDGASVWIQAVAWSPDGSRIASGDANGKIHIWDAATGKQLTTCNGHTGRIYSLTWSPDSKYFASGCGDSTMQVWDSSTGQSLFTYYHSAPVNSVAWSPDGSRIATGCDDRIARIWPY